jgi:hypothetical protein
MPQTQTSCPRCRQPVIAEVEQLLDMNVDPQAKQKLLSGQINAIVCQNCGYQGPIATPVVYHDPEKELLLTYFPPELGLPVNEQERMIGPLITRVVDKLVPEKRKAYIFRPQTMLTYQTLLEKVLEADGITREMLDAQQKRLNLLQRLLTTQAADVRSEIIKQEEALIDTSFFAMLSQLAQALIQNNDQQTVRALGAMQQELLEQTKTGQELKAQYQDREEAVKTLQEASKGGLTREKLLDLLIAAPNDNRLSVMVSLTRQGLDYTFFQILTERIEKASGEEKEKLTQLREKLLELTKAIDQAIQQHYADARKLLNDILAAADIEKAVVENMEGLDDIFLEVLRSEVTTAREKADFDRSGKLQTILGIIEKASAPPPEVELINKLVSAETDEERLKLLEENADMVTEGFVQAFNSILVQSQEDKSQPQEVKEHLEAAYRSAMRFSMARNLKK